MRNNAARQPPANSSAFRRTAGFCFSADNEPALRLRPCEITAAATSRKIPFPLRKINVKSLHSTIHEEMPVISAVIYILTVSFAAYAIYKVQAK